MKKNALDWLVMILLAYLPWHVVVSVFSQFRLEITPLAALKEILVLVIAIAACWRYFQDRRLPRLRFLDWSIIAYIAVLLLVSLVNGLGLGQILLGARYDFEFLITFLVVRHTLPYLSFSARRYLQVFLISGAGAIVMGIFVRFLFGESILVGLGFSPYVSQWDGTGAPPVYHGVHNANVHRWQGIFDGPNQAAYFLLIYLGVFLHAISKKSGYQVLIYTWSTIIIGLIVMTQSRSSYIGLLAGIGTLVVALVIHALHSGGSVARLARRYRIHGIIVACILLVFGLGFLAKFEGKVSTMLERWGSTKAHIERAVIGYYRWTEKPLGWGLAEAGSAARTHYGATNTDTGEFSVDNENITAYMQSQYEKNPLAFSYTSESYYIPESWYIQQLVEGGILGFLAFMTIMITLAWQLLWRSPYLLASWAAVLTMNLVLHSFETMWASLALFTILALILDQKSMGKIREEG